MKTLSLKQPWASLVALGAKHIETRDWKTPYRGPLAIHASANFSRVEIDLVYEPSFFDALLPLQGSSPKLLHELLPLGAIVAKCELVGCYPTTGRGYMVEYDHHPSRYDSIVISEREKAFGDYTPGRYAWVLENIERVDPPIPCKGGLRLWEWNEGMADPNYRPAYKLYGGTPGYVAGSPTSYEAALSVSGEARESMKTRVLAYIKFRGPEGVTDDEIERALGMRHQTASARRRDLEKDDGTVVPKVVPNPKGGKPEKVQARRPTSSGRTAGVYVHIDYAEREIVPVGVSVADGKSIFVDEVKTLRPDDYAVAGSLTLEQNEMPGLD